MSRFSDTARRDTLREAFMITSERTETAQLVSRIVVYVALTVAQGGQATVKRAARQASYAGVCSAQSETTEQLLVQPKTRMGSGKSGKPLFGGVWSVDDSGAWSVVTRVRHP